MSKGTRIKRIMMTLKAGDQVAWERGEQGVKQITETPEQLVVMRDGDWYHFYPKESIEVFSIQTEEFELKSEGGIILPDTAANQIVKEPF